MKSTYPIRLHIQLRTQLWSLIFAVFIAALGMVVFAMSSKEHDAVVQSASLFLIGLGGFMSIAFMYMIWLKKPAIIIQSHGMVFLSLFQASRKIELAWQDVEAMHLDFMTHKFAKQWLIVIVPKTGSGKPIRRPLQPMVLDGIKLNEHEVFDVIKQSYQGETPKLTATPMGVGERVDLTFVLLVILAICVPVVISWIF